MSAWRYIADAAAHESAALTRAWSQPAHQQSQFLHAILAANRDTQFGREHHFAQIRSVDDFRRAVPLRRDDEFAPWLERVARGDPAVLTADPVIAFEATGGNAAGAKLIPYTAASLRAFRAGVLPWLSYLLTRLPRIAAGMAYVAASPVTRAPRTLACGVPLGLPSDAAYLGADLAPALSRVITVPPASSDLAGWRVATLAHLVRQHDLTLISVWSPTFLLELLDALPREAEQVFASMRGARDSAAIKRLERALATNCLTEHLWPQLQTVSMWMDGASAPYAARVGALLSGVHLDAKGVLATESVLTVRTAAGCVPALTSAFLEFIVDDEPRLAHDLEAGVRYRAVITTPGGLYRYDIGDEFECTQVNAGVPALRFIGRAGVISDLVGEKLTDSFVAGALAGILTGASLVPRRTPNPHYELWLDSDEPAHGQLAARVEERLNVNPQYAYAREMGQLRALEIVCAPGFMQHRARQLAAQGRRFGDAKGCALLLEHEGT